MLMNPIRNRKGFAYGAGGTIPVTMVCPEKVVEGKTFYV